MSAEIEQHAQSKLPHYDGTFIERLAEKLGITATAKSVYADPVERDGITIIPVAKVRYGFGGGRQEGKQQAEGGGGGVQVVPVGYIELKEGSSKFRRISNPAATLRVLASGLIGLLILRRFLRPHNKHKSE